MSHEGRLGHSFRTMQVVERPKRARRSSEIRPANNDLGLKTQLASSSFVILVTCAIVLTPILVLASFIPFAAFGTLPTLCVNLLVLVLSVPQLAYLWLAQDDAPPHASRPFLATNLRRCLQIDYAVWRWCREALGVGHRVLIDWAIRKVRPGSYGSFFNIPYSQDLASLLDVYTPSRDMVLNSSEDAAQSLIPPAEGLSTADNTNQNRSALPVVVFFAQQIRPLPSGKFVYSSIGGNLASQLNVIVVIADLTPYPAARLKEQIVDAKLVLQWVKRNIRRYGGDPKRIYLSGHGLSAHLALLLPIQAAVGESRDRYMEEREQTGSTTDDLPNGVLDVKVYGNDITLPPIEGLILFAPITNVDQHITDEGRVGIQHLSMVRRVLGPGERTCFFHSPAHLLYAARNIINTSLLPKKVLFLHGGLDKTVKHDQTEAMKELLRGIGLKDTRVRLYGVGHWGIILPIMCGMDGPPVLDEIRELVWGHQRQA